MMGGPQKVQRTVCMNCESHGTAECNDCPAKMIYDAADEYYHDVYYREFANTSRAFRERCDIKAARYYKSHNRHK